MLSEDWAEEAQRHELLAYPVVSWILPWTRRISFVDGVAGRLPHRLAGLKVSVHELIPGAVTILAMFS
jgi:hypothetical protein